MENSRAIPVLWYFGQSYFMLLFAPTEEEADSLAVA